MTKVTHLPNWPAEILLLLLLGLLLGLLLLGVYLGVGRMVLAGDSDAASSVGRDTVMSMLSRAGDKSSGSSSAVVAVFSVVSAVADSAEAEGEGTRLEGLEAFLIWPFWSMEGVVVFDLEARFILAA